MPEQTGLPHRVMKISCRHCVTGIDAEFPEYVARLTGVTCPSCGASYTVERVDDGGNYEIELGRLAYSTYVTVEGAPGQVRVVYGTGGPTDQWAQRTIDPGIPRAAEAFADAGADDAIRQVHEATRTMKVAAAEGAQLPGHPLPEAPMPCPFCGEEATVDRVENSDEEFPSWCVSCNDIDCGAEGPRAPTAAAAVGRWNRRGGHTFTRHQVAMLRRAMMVYRNRMQSLRAGESGQWDELSQLLEAQVPPEASDA